MDKGNPMHYYIAGAVGGTAGLVIGHPFDTTKVQLQTREGKTAFRSTLQAMKHINTHGWSHGFFRGLGFPFITYGLVNSIFFGVYGNTLKFLEASGDSDAKYLNVYLAGCIGGATQLVVACPVDVIKVILQAQLPNGTTGAATSFRNPIHCLRMVYRHGGMRACYGGFGVMAVRDINASSIYFLVYEWLYSRMVRHKLTDSQGVVASFTAGGAAGVLSWLPIMPFDVIKSRMQADHNRTKYRSVWHCVHRTYAVGGPQAFFSGVGVAMVRAFLVNAVTFLVYSRSIDLLRG